MRSKSSAGGGNRTCCTPERRRRGPDNFFTHAGPGRGARAGRTTHFTHGKERDRDNGPRQEHRSRRRERGGRGAETVLVHQPETGLSRLPDRRGRHGVRVRRDGGRACCRTIRRRTGCWRITSARRTSASRTILNGYPGRDGAAPSKLPARTFVLDRHGLARALSLPPGDDEFVSDIVSSYRVKQGVLHNPKSDRRTTQGIFHVTEGGLPDPRRQEGRAEGRLRATAARWRLTPPPRLLRLPFTAGQTKQAECFVSLLLRPLVCPAVPGVTPEKTMEVRFFAPGNLVSNLDFVESIFGNAGDPLPAGERCRAGRRALDRAHRLRHSRAASDHADQEGASGLPHWDDATERQRRDGMCWKTRGRAVQRRRRVQADLPRRAAASSSRSSRTTISATAKKKSRRRSAMPPTCSAAARRNTPAARWSIPSYDLGEEFSGDLHAAAPRTTRSPKSRALFGERDGRAARRLRRRQAVTRTSSMCRKTRVSTCTTQTVTLARTSGDEQSIKLLPGKTYVRPSGLQGPHGESRRARRAWRLVGTTAEGTFCHKPCTVSGGGKSEISKPHHRRHPARAGLRRRLREGLRPGRGADRARLRRPLPATRLARQGQPPAPQPGALARLGHQTADARRRASTPTSTTTGWKRSRSTSKNWSTSSSGSTSPSGATTGASISAWTSSTARPATNCAATGASWSPATCASAIDAGRLVAHVRPAQGLPPRRQVADGRRHHGLGRRPAAALHGT